MPFSIFTSSFRFIGMDVYAFKILANHDTLTAVRGQTFTNGAAIGFIVAVSFNFIGFTICESQRRSPQVV